VQQHQAHHDTTSGSRPSAALKGEWAAGQPVAMTKDEQGVGSVTVGALKPELYAYTFVVGGYSHRFRNATMACRPSGVSWCPTS